MSLKIKMKNRLRLTFFLTLLIFFLLYFPTKLVAEENFLVTTRLSSEDARTSYPQIASGNFGYGAVWVDNRFPNSELYFASINSAGQQVGKEQRITENFVHNLTPALVWNGEDFGLFWSYSKSSIYFTRVSEQGMKLIGDIPTVTSTRGYAIHISAVWNGEEYGVTWWDVRDAPPCNPSGTRGRAFFVRVDKNGQKIGEEIPVADVFSNPWQDYKPFIVWDGENYAIFWNDSRENGECAGGYGDIYMAKVNRYGEKILGDIKLQSNEPNPQLTDVAWDGENYVIGYNGSVVKAHIAKMDTNGDTIWADIPINPNGFGGALTITSYDDKYYIAWGDFRDRTPETFYNTEIYYTITDKDGNNLIPETRLTFQDDTQRVNTKILFNKKSMGLAWLDYRDGTPQVYFNLFKQSIGL